MKHRISPNRGPVGGGLCAAASYRGDGTACREWCTPRTSPIAASASSLAARRVRNAVTACAFLVPWRPARERRRAAVDSDGVPAVHPQMNSGTSRARRRSPCGAGCVRGNGTAASRAEGQCLLCDHNRPTHAFDDTLRSPRRHPAARRVPQSIRTLRASPPLALWPIDRRSRSVAPSAVAPYCNLARSRRGTT